MVIPCLCLFIALSSLFSELVGAKPLHLLTQTVLLLAQTQTSDKQKRTRTLFLKARKQEPHHGQFPDAMRMCGELIRSNVQVLQRGMLLSNDRAAILSAVRI